MADDWIKMSVHIRSHPKVIRMGILLHKNENFLRYAYNNVTGHERDTSVTGGVTDVVGASVVAAGLLQIWGAVRKHGKIEGDDMVIKPANLADLDRLSGVPGLGEVMHAVGWAIEEDNSLVRFPNCLENMTSPEEREREKNRARKQRQREREQEEKGRDNDRDMSRNMSRQCHADVTPREEKRREDIKELSINKQTLIDTKKNHGLVAEKQETKKDRKPRVPTDLVNQIFQDWKTVLLHPTSKLGKKRGDVIREAVRMGYTAEQMHNAFIGCARSSFHAGFNEQGKKYDDLELILRNEKNIDRFISYSTRPPKPTWKPQDNTSLNVRREATKYYESACKDARCGIDIVGTGTTIDAESWEVLQPNLAH